MHFDLTKKELARVEDMKKWGEGAWYSKSLQFPDEHLLALAFRAPELNALLKPLNRRLNARRDPEAARLLCQYEELQEGLEVEDLMTIAKLDKEAAQNLLQYHEDKLGPFWANVLTAHIRETWGPFALPPYKDGTCRLFRPTVKKADVTPSIFTKVDQKAQEPLKEAPSSSADTEATNRSSNCHIL